MRFVPSEVTWLMMSRWAESPTEETASTDITPMMMPSIVKNVRLFAAASTCSE